MNENFCIDICRQCKLRCVIRKKDGIISHYGCFGKKGYKEFIRNFNGTVIVSHAFALSSETGEFVSPLIEFKFAKALRGYGKTSSESEMVFRMDDSSFYDMISREYKECQYLPEMQIAEWSKVL